MDVVILFYYRITLSRLRRSLFWLFLESPYQECGGVNFADIIDRLDFQLERIADLPESRRYILTRRFRYFIYFFVGLGRIFGLAGYPAD